MILIFLKNQYPIDTLFPGDPSESQIRSVSQLMRISFEALISIDLTKIALGRFCQVEPPQKLFPNGWKSKHYLH